MGDFVNSVLPPEFQQAGDALKNAFSSQPLPADAQGTQQTLPDLKVAVSKGFNVRSSGPNSATDTLLITIESPSFTTSETADAVGKMALDELNKIDAVRNQVILVSPSEYKANVKKEVTELLEEAKKAEIPGSDFDFAKSKIFDPSYSDQQTKVKHGVQLIEGPRSTSIRINIPTNPHNLEESKQTADAIAADLTQRLPEVKKEVIARIVDKSYIANLDDAGKKHLEAHELKVSTQQQGNWTSVFLDITSPEQQEANKNPGQTVDSAALAKTNMMAKILDEETRFKLAARAAMFKDEKLRSPAKYFADVAGAKDLKSAIGKVLKPLALKKPELAARIEALRNEDVFKATGEQWNLPEEQREKTKPVVSAAIDPKNPQVMEINLTLPKGQAIEVVKQIANLNKAKEAATAAAPAQDVIPFAPQSTVASGAAPAAESPAALASDIIARNPSFAAQVDSDKAKVATYQGRGAA